MGNLKEVVLQQSNYGLDFFQFVINSLELKDEGKCELVLNPFYHDTKPGLSIYFNPENERWMFNDFGDESFKGDVFDFASIYYELDAKKDFYKILKLMADDLGIENQNEYSEAVTKAINVFSYKVDYKNGDGLEEAFEYFKQFGITKAVLKSYGVRAIQRAYHTDKDNRIKSSLFKEDELFISFEHVYFAKVYSPDPKGFFYVGSKPKDFVFGFSQIIGRAHRAKSFPETLILTGGEKDVLTLTSLGYDAISLNSETASIPKSLTENLFNCYKNIVVFYDNDETGKRKADQIRKELRQRFNVSVCHLPEVIGGKRVKDVSDYMKHGLPIADLQLLIDQSIQTDDSEDETKSLDAAADDLKDKSPVLPDWIYTQLPEFLKELALQFSENDERDLALISSLAVLSSCFPKVKGYYGYGKVAANMYFFVTAPPSAGKGVMMYAKRLISGIQDLLIQDYKREYRKYLSDEEHYRENIKTNPDLEKPEKPKQKVMQIPANISASMMIDLLGANENFGVILESEGSTLSTALKTDWSNYSDILLKAAHHETISKARKGSNEFIEIHNPCLSVVLSGTPNRVQELVGGIENGLTSRFLFYELTHVKPWKNQFDIPDMSREDVYNKASEYVCKLWKMQMASSETIVRIPDFGAKLHTEFFSEKFEGMRASYGNEIIASVRRHGLLCYRMMMLLAIFRYLEQHDTFPEILDVTEQDVNLAIVITEVLMVHLVTIFKRLESSTVMEKLNTKQRNLLEALPETFSKKQYTEIREAQGLKKAVAEKYIGDLISRGAIIRIDQGQYQKAA